MAGVMGLCFIALIIFRVIDRVFSDLRFIFSCYCTALIQGFLIHMHRFLPSGSRPALRFRLFDCFRVSAVYGFLHDGVCGLTRWLGNGFGIILLDALGENADSGGLVFCKIQETVIVRNLLGEYSNLKLYGECQL